MNSMVQKSSPRTLHCSFCIWVSRACNGCFPMYKYVDFNDVWIDAFGWLAAFIVCARPKNGLTTVLQRATSCLVYSTCKLLYHILSFWFQHQILMYPSLNMDPMTKTSDMDLVQISFFSVRLVSCAVILRYKFLVTILTWKSFVRCPNSYFW
jgi:hypothetical protein